MEKTHDENWGHGDDASDHRDQNRDHEHETHEP
jgi:hypothetical protein